MINTRLFAAVLERLVLFPIKTAWWLTMILSIFKNTPNKLQYRLTSTCYKWPTIAMSTFQRKSACTVITKWNFSVKGGKLILLLPATIAAESFWRLQETRLYRTWKFNQSCTTNINLMFNLLSYWFTFGCLIFQNKR